MTRKSVLLFLADKVHYSAAFFLLLPSFFYIMNNTTHTTGPSVVTKRLSKKGVLSTFNKNRYTHS